MLRVWEYRIRVQNSTESWCQNVSSKSQSQWNVQDHIKAFLCHGPNNTNIILLQINDNPYPPINLNFPSIFDKVGIKPDILITKPWHVWVRARPGSVVHWMRIPTPPSCLVKGWGPITAYIIRCSSLSTPTKRGVGMTCLWPACGLPVVQACRIPAGRYMMLINLQGSFPTWSYLLF